MRIARLPRWLRIPLSVLLAVGSLALSGCVGFRTINKRIEHTDPSYGYRTTRAGDFRERGDLTIYLAFSGGGTRAAAFGYGVLEALRDTEITIHGEHRRLLDQVDAVSGVSGGSFPAAYYGLFGDRVFQEFEPRFLRRNIQGAIIWRVFWPWNTVALFTPWLSRSDIAAGIYNGSVFEKGTFGDLQRAHGPRVYVNATDLSSGERFVFNQNYFDLICSDVNALPIAYAVAASSAVPALLSPISLRNYAGTCGARLSPVIEQALSMRQTDPRRYRAAQSLAGFADPGKRYLHLVDGGISDNLGLRAGLDLISVGGGLRQTVALLGEKVPRYLVIIAVNAETNPPRQLDLSAAAPGLAAMMNAVAGAQIRRYNFETLMLARESLKNWVNENNRQGGHTSGYLIEVSFDNLADEKERQKLKDLPTSFSLKGEQIDELLAAARTLLDQSPDFQRLLAELKQDEGEAAEPAPAVRPADAPVEAPKS
jgi:NTE family protein